MSSERSVCGWRARTLVVGLVALVAASSALAGGGRWVYRDPGGREIHRSVGASVAQLWAEELLEAIRRDFARPTVHARNLFHTSVAMWDAWAAFDDVADQYFHHERMTAADVEAARREAISYACYRLLRHRFDGSPGWSVQTEARLNALMGTLGYDTGLDATDQDEPWSLGNRIAAGIIQWGLLDGANEALDYANLYYEPVNEPILPDLPGNPDISDPNRWQPIVLDFFVDQSGNIIPGGSPDFLSPEWGQVDAFALRQDDLTVYERDGFDYLVYHDPGAPPYIGGAGDEYYHWGFEMVVAWSAHLDPTDGVMWDISPASLGNSPLPAVDDWASYYDFLAGGDWGEGWDLNPATGQPYPPQVVPRGDYARILAEFWADGPDSETPPGHWWEIMTYVLDHPLFEARFGGEGPIMDDLEFDVRAYLVMGTAMHDVAVSAWGVKGWYDYIRPVSAIRHMCDLGQRSDPGLPNYHPQGITLIPGLIEVITPQSSAAGERHAHLWPFVGLIAIKAWRGPDYIVDPEFDDAGVDWILAAYWWPYQRPSFVTPPFAGYVSGHSTYSRAAAEVMTLLTGTPFFPGGVGEFFCPQNQFLVFEEGPSVDVTLQWATYQDASDQTSLSRIWGGIHPPADDLPGRHMGQVIGPDAFHLAERYMDGRFSCPADYAAPKRSLDLADVDEFVARFDEADPSVDLSGAFRQVDYFDAVVFQNAFALGCQSPAVDGVRAAVDEAIRLDLRLATLVEISIEGPASASPGEAVELEVWAEVTGLPPEGAIGGFGLDLDAVEGAGLLAGFTEATIPTLTLGALLGEAGPSSLTRVVGGQLANLEGANPGVDRSRRVLLFTTEATIDPSAAEGEAVLIVPSNSAHGGVPLHPDADAGASALAPYNPFTVMGLWGLEIVVGSAPLCPGDTDHDGDTDVFDFATLVETFGERVHRHAGGDVTGDGVVDVYDVASLAGGFGCAE